MSDRNYNVGYGRPPKHTQFKKGQCANPGGRGVRKSEDFLEKVALRKLLNGKVKYTTQGTSKQATRLELLARKHVSLALKGNVRSAVALIKMHSQFSSARIDTVDWVTFTGGPGPREGENWIKVSDH